uniref:5'-nucleotidase n=1 Tax=Ornithorhynchus anatinus TaxID=9258 RepID=F7G3X1_ORNAN
MAEGEGAPGPRPPFPLLLPVLLLCQAAAGASWELTLLHTNDLHSRLEPTSVESGKCQGPPRACFGGVARLATQVGRLRQAHPNVLLLDAGDQYQGTIWFTVYKGVEVAHFMNALRYDAMETHEFDNGGGRSLPTSKPGVHWPLASPDSTIRTRSSMWGSEKVGVVGYTSRETPVLSNPGRDLEFEDEITALQPQVDKLKTLGVNKIIALGHSGFEMDKLIAQKVRGVDVVIGGHTNTFLYTGTPPSIEVPAGAYPFIVTSEDGRRVPVVQAYAFGKYLGHLQVVFDEAGNVISSSGNPILLNDSIPEDPSIKAELDKWKVMLTNYSSQELGRTAVFLNGSTQSCRFEECNLGNLICDAMIHNNLKHPDELRWNHVSMCIMNGGGIRASISEKNNGISSRRGQAGAGRGGWGSSFTFSACDLFPPSFLQVSPRPGMDWGPGKSEAGSSSPFPEMFC